MGPKNWFKRNRSADSSASQQSTPATSRASSNDSSCSRDEIFGRKSKKSRPVVMNLGDVRGYQAVVGTCDIRHDRQATAELIDLLNLTADKLYPPFRGEADGENGTDGPCDVQHDGAGDETAYGKTAAAEASREPLGGKKTSYLAKLRLERPQDGSNTARSVDASGGSGISLQDSINNDLEAERAGIASRFVSVNTSVKGVIMVCVKDPEVKVIDLVDALFDEIRSTGKRRSRFLERVTPMAVTAYADFKTLKSAAKEMMLTALPPVAEGVPPISLPPRELSTTTTRKVPGESTSTPDASIADEEGSTLKQSAAAEVGGGGDGDSESEAMSSSNDVSAAGAEEKVSDDASSVAVTTTSTSITKGDGAAEPTKAEETAGRQTTSKRWTFRVDPRRRNTGLSRIDLINSLASSAGEGHSVTMTNPEVSYLYGSLR